MIVQTCSSLYAMRVIVEGWFKIAGGWFHRKGASPMKVRINGCTRRPRAMSLNIAAACGLCLEFGSRVMTTSVQRIFIFTDCILK